MEKTTEQAVLCSVLLTKYHSGEQIKKTEMGKVFSIYGGEQRCVQGLMGKPEKMRPLERSRRRWEDNIKMELREVGCGAWTESIWLRRGTGGGLL